MGKRIFLLLICGWLGCAAAWAQVTMVLQVPPSGVMQKSQLWNMSLVNGSSSSLIVRVSLTLINIADNQPAMTAVTPSITLTKGANQISAKDVGGINYTYLSPLFNVDRDPNGFLPIGNFKACYTVISFGHGESTLAEDCIPVEVQPLSPPQLVQPADSAVLEISYPQFSWLPPLPINLFSDLTYDLFLVEVQSGQGAYEAIQNNIPVYSIRRYKDPVNIYPASNAPLDTGKTYAWRIVALNEDQFVAQSEVWTFRLAQPKPATVKVVRGNYIPLKKANEPSSGVEVLTDRNVGVKYYSFSKPYTATIRFLGTDGVAVKTVSQNIVYGDNYLGFQLDKTFVTGKVYKLEITDPAGEKQVARFILKSTN